MKQITKDLHRLRRIFFHSPAEKRFLKTMGWWFFIRYDVKQEYKLSGFVVDFALPSKRIAIEIDGKNYHGGNKDIIRDMALHNAGWYVYRIKAEELWRRPVETKRYVKLFCRNPQAYIKRYG